MWTTLFVKDPKIVARCRTGVLHHLVSVGSISTGQSAIQGRVRRSDHEHRRIFQQKSGDIHLTQIDKPRTLLSWSTGKDAAWALHTLRQAGEVEVVGLLTTINSEFGRVAMHSTRQSLLE